MSCYRIFQLSWFQLYYSHFWKIVSWYFKSPEIKCTRACWSKKINHKYCKHNSMWELSEDILSTGLQNCINNRYTHSPFTSKLHEVVVLNKHEALNCQRNTAHSAQQHVPTSLALLWHSISPRICICALSKSWEID